MEGTDQHILSLLAADGRMSFTDIGREAGLSTSAAQQRVRRLEQRGIIEGYTARINAGALGRTLTAFVSIRPLDPVHADRVPDVLRPIGEVKSLWTVAGDASYTCLVEVGSTAELDALLNRIRSEANAATVTTVVLTTVFKDRPFVPEQSQH